MSNITQLPTPIKGKDISLIIGESTVSNIKQALARRAKMLGKVRGYEYRGASRFALERSNFIDPVYDLAEISRVADVEPYIAQSVRKLREQVLKQGFDITGEDDDMVAYIKQRLFEISLLTEISTEKLIRDLVSNVILFHNGFLVFRRDATRSSGSPIRYFGKELDPIAGVFVGDPTSMQVKVDKYGTVRKWNQKIFSDTGTVAEREFFPEDVIHISVDKKPGYTFGTPYILPVLDDIRALRKLEELAVIVVSKEAFPLFHYKVGSETAPAIVYEGGESEVDYAMSQVTNLPPQGFIVTSERAEISLIGKEGAIIDMAPYIEYFEARVLAGLRLSPIDLGRSGSSNRGTATTINQNLESTAKEYQSIIADAISQQLILPLLLEGGYDVTPDNMVKFCFNCINTEEQRAEQNHGLQLMMGNAITSSEYRKKYLNRKAFTEEDVKDTERERDTGSQIRIMKEKPVAGASRSGSDRSSAGRVSGQVKNRAKPANQYGSTTKKRVTANDGQYRQDCIEFIGKLRSELLTDADLDQDAITSFVDAKLHSLVTSLVEASNESVLDAINNGVAKAEKEFEKVNPETDYTKQDIGRRSIERFFLNFVNKSIWKALNPYKDSLYSGFKRDADGNSMQHLIVSILEDIRKDLLELVDMQLITAERFGFIKFAKRMGYKNIDLLDLDTAEVSKIDISNIIYKSFIPTPKQNATLVFPKESNETSL